MKNQKQFGQRELHYPHFAIERYRPNILWTLLTSTNMTLKNFLTPLLLIVSLAVAGQKFMIKDNDTLPYFTKIAEGTCETFEKINGAIVNRTDGGCLRQGLWIITDSFGNYWTGIYHDNVETGIWKFFDTSRRLIKESESISVGKEIYEIKEVDYSSGHAVTIIDKPFLAFYLKNIYIIVGLFFITFFSRGF